MYKITHRNPSRYFFSHFAIKDNIKIYNVIVLKIVTFNDHSKMNS